MEESIMEAWEKRKKASLGFETCVIEVSLNWFEREDKTTACVVKKMKAFKSS